MSDLCIHGMLPGTCSECTPRRQQVVLDTPVLISPQHMGHLEGCEHKGEDPDYSRWGSCTAPGAWRNLVNGNAITANNGHVLGLVASSACLSCIERSLT